MLTKKVILFLCYVAMAQHPDTPAKSKTAPSTEAAKNTADKAKAGDFYVSKKDYAEFQKLQADLANSVSTQSSGKKCHVEYRNCWTDHETRCSPNPGGTVHCETVPVRRCGKPELVCD
jgi:hypothetical protein